MSLIPLAFEEEFGHPPLLKKVSFSPQPMDFCLLSAADVSFGRLYPPPNALEGLLEGFNRLYHQEAINEIHR